MLMIDYTYVVCWSVLEDLVNHGLEDLTESVLDVRSVHLLLWVRHFMSCIKIFIFNDLIKVKSCKI